MRIAYIKMSINNVYATTQGKLFHKGNKEISSDKSTVSLLLHNSQYLLIYVCFQPWHSLSTIITRWL